MRKEAYISSLRASHEEALEEELELAWHLQSMEKAKEYIAVLSRCTDYEGVVEKVVRKMYEAKEISEKKAKNEKFLGLLLTFTCLEGKANAHSLAHHVGEMLAKAKKNTKKLSLVQTGELIQIKVTPENKELIRRLLDLLEETGVSVTYADEKPVSGIVGGPSVHLQVKHRFKPQSGLKHKLGGTYAYGIRKSVFLPQPKVGLRTFQISGTPEVLSVAVAKLDSALGRSVAIR